MFFRCLLSFRWFGFGFVRQCFLCVRFDHVCNLCSARLRMDWFHAISSNKQMEKERWKRTKKPATTVWIKWENSNHKNSCFHYLWLELYAFCSSLVFSIPFLYFVVHTVLVCLVVASSQTQSDDKRQTFVHWQQLLQHFTYKFRNIFIDEPGALPNSGKYIRMNAYNSHLKRRNILTHYT